jgi:hypothetical protein
MNTDSNARCLRLDVAGRLSSIGPVSSLVPLRQRPSDECFLDGWGRLVVLEGSPEDLDTTLLTYTGIGPGGSGKQVNALWHGTLIAGRRTAQEHSCVFVYAQTLIGVIPLSG